MEALEVCYTGGAAIEKELNRLLLKDNIQNRTMIEKIGGRLPKDLPNEVLESIKIKVLEVLQKPQKDEYISTEENVLKMKKKLMSLKQGKAFKDFPYLAMSYFTKVTTTEAMFGNPDEEQPNLAYSICESVMKLNFENRSRALQNIILSGGTCMIPGFKLRLKQEIKSLIRERSEFEEQRVSLKFVKIPESVFPPNCMPWVGASLLMNLGQEVDRFLMTDL